MSAPFLVFGVARSGTNLISRMLDAHPQVAIALDPLMPLFKAWRNLAVTRYGSPALRAASEPTAAFQDYYFDQTAPELLKLILGARAGLEVPSADQADIIAGISHRAALESPSLARALCALRGATIGELLKSAFRLIRDEAVARGKRQVSAVGSKEVWTIEYAAALLRYFPQARAIVLHRDPRSVVASVAAMGKKDPTQAAHLISYLRHWRKHVAVANHLASLSEFSGRLHVVRFEDVLADPESHAKRMADFLGIAYHQEMLAPGAGAWGGNSSFGPLQAPIDTAAAERWRKHLTKPVLETTQYYCGPEMGLVGYSDAFSGKQSQAVIDVTIAADAAPGSWRSDSGNTQANLDWEGRRYDLLARSSEVASISDIERCFLFPSIYGKARLRAQM